MTTWMLDDRQYETLDAAAADAIATWPRIDYEGDDVVSRSVVRDDGITAELHPWEDGSGIVIRVDVLASTADGRHAKVWQWQTDHAERDSDVVVGTWAWSLYQGATYDVADYVRGGDALPNLDAALNDALGANA